MAYAGSQVLLQIARFAVAIVLARLLAPEEFGIAAMVLVASGAIILFGDSALGTALIQRRVITDADRSTVFWTGAAVGVALTAAGIALAGPLARFYDEPKVEPLFAVLSLSFVIAALGTTQSALLLRDMDYRRLELRRVAAGIVSSAIAIALAFAGFGAWAIVGQQVAYASCETALIWMISPWRPSFTFSSTSLRGLAGFSGSVFGQNALYYITRNVDNVLIGRYLGASALGAYALAYNVMLAPFNHIAGPLQQVLFPALSRMQDDPKRLADVWIRVTRLVAAVSMPALVGLVVVAPDFVSTVLGQKWSAATPVIRILAVVGLIQTLQHLNGEILYALDRAGTFFRFTIFWAIASVVAFGIGVQWGIVGVAACYAITSAFVEPVSAYLTARAVDLPLRTFVVALSGVAQAAALMGLLVFGLRMLMIEAGVPAPARLVLVTIAGIVLYIPACFARAPEVVAEVTDVVRRRSARRADVVAAGATGSSS